jgi:uncharacterized membrane protein YccC
MGAGAMLVGIAWRTGGGRPPVALMATDAAVMGISTFVGCVTGSHAGLHLLVLCLWSLAAGMLVSVGRRGAVVGTQAIIAVVVFGRFSEPAAQALGLAGLVLAGGCAQVAFLSIARWPTTLRSQRAATGNAYRALAALAPASPQASTLPAGLALDAAQDTLASPALFADPALMRLRSLVITGHRVRISLNAIHALMKQRPGTARSDPGPSGVPALAAVMALASSELTVAAAVIEGDVSATAALSETAVRFTAAVTALNPPATTGGNGPAPAPAPIVSALTALAGQLRAVSMLACTAAEGGTLRSRRPYRRTEEPLAFLRNTLAQIRANASLDSPAARHALRLAVVVPLAELISRALPLQRGYWMVVAAAAVLRPEFGATFTRGAERALGTCLGVTLAGVIAASLHPAGAVTVTLVGGLAWAGYATFPASFAAGFAFITALVVFLLNVLNPDTFPTAEARLLDTLVGGALGLLAFALWPTWSRTPARQALAELVDAERAYLGGVLAARLRGATVSERVMRPLARRLRLARTNAEAIVARSLSEPPTRRIDAAQSQGILAALGRFTQAAHVLRVDAQDEDQRGPLPLLSSLASEIDRQLRLVSRQLTDEALAESDPPDLRARFGAFQRACPGDHGVLLAEIDEIVDASNTLAALTRPQW